MRKLIVIIILLISGFSYYGIVDENGEKVTVFENVVEKENIVEQIQEDNKITSKIIEEYKNTEIQNQVEDVEKEKIEIPKVQETQNQTTENTVKQQTTTNKAEQKTQATTTITSKANNTNTSTNKNKTTVNKQQNSSYTEKEVKVAEKTECVGNNHKMESGNTGKWFNTKTEADNYYNAEIEKWGKQWENDEITKEKYLKKCPSGYEVWTCPQCQKWTLNFYYR